MKLSAENYTSPKILKKQAIKVWIAGLAVVFLWVFVILLAPIAEANNAASVSRPIYTFFSFLCHQMPERSFHIENHAFAVCSRCFGVYFGLLFGFIIYPFFRSLDEIEPLPRIWLFLAIIPLAIDWSLGFFEIWENTHLSRFLTGLILGTACGIFIVPAIVEIARLLRRSPHISKGANG